MEMIKAALHEGDAKYERNHRIHVRIIKTPYQSHHSCLSEFRLYILSLTPKGILPQSVNKHVQIHNRKLCLVAVENNIHTHAVRV